MCCFCFNCLFIYLFYFLSLFFPSLDFEIFRKRKVCSWKLVISWLLSLWLWKFFRVFDIFVQHLICASASICNYIYLFLLFALFDEISCEALLQKRIGFIGFWLWEVGSVSSMFLTFLLQMKESNNLFLNFFIPLFLNFSIVLICLFVCLCCFECFVFCSCTSIKWLLLLFF